MLFNSPEFLFAFLPVCLAVYFWLGRGPRVERRPLLWLVLASLFFYAWWDWHNLLLLGTSLWVNYYLSQYLIRRTDAGAPALWALRGGIIFNLALIIWFKYGNFFAATAGAAFGQSWSLGDIALPLAISFFTFQQISYLVDGYRGKVTPCAPLDYALVVTFFPHLIAGPIVRYQDVLPQFKDTGIFRFSRDAFAAGLSLFLIGLAKKMLFADSIAPYANLAYGASAEGIALTFTEAWVGTLAYGMQLYFDFSGYSDMAIGLAWMFGIRFSLNFNSPYKSRNIQEFWRRWHMTLSSFLRDYLYIALGGNRHGEGRRMVNLFLTMLLGGLWHGAGWNFVLWGGLHGGYLIVHQLWMKATARLGFAADRPLMPVALAWSLTFVAAMVAWVPFRAVNLDSTLQIWGAMAGANGLQLPNFMESWLAPLAQWGATFDGFTANVGIAQKYSMGGILLLLMIAVVMPNSQEIMGRFNPALESVRGQVPTLLGWLQWRPSLRWSVIAGALAAVCVLCMTRVSQFIYFQF